MLQLLYQFLMTQLCRTYMINLLIVNQFEKHYTFHISLIPKLRQEVKLLAFCLDPNVC